MTIHQSIEAAPGKYRLKHADYAVLDEAGCFGDTATELVQGEIFLMSPEWRPHMRIKDELAYRIRRQLEKIGARWFVGTGGSLALGEHDMPRPDILLTDAIEGEGAVPASSVALVVEVSASTLDHDLDGKARLYATARIPEYWVVDVAGSILHRLSAPAEGAFADHRQIAFGEPVTSATIPGLTVDTARL